MSRPAPDYLTAELPVTGELIVAEVKAADLIALALLGARAPAVGAAAGVNVGAVKVAMAANVGAVKAARGYGVGGTQPTSAREALSDCPTALELADAIRDALDRR